MESVILYRVNSAAKKFVDGQSPEGSNGKSTQCERLSARNLRELVITTGHYNRSC